LRWKDWERVTSVASTACTSSSEKTVMPGSATQDLFLNFCILCFRAFARASFVGPGKGVSLSAASENTGAVAFFFGFGSSTGFGAGAGAGAAAGAAAGGAALAVSDAAGAA